MSTALPIAVETRPRTLEAHPRTSWSHRLHALLERPLGDLEPACRQHHLRSDVDQACLGMAMMSIPMLLFAVADYLLVGPGSAFAILMVMRLAFMSFTLAVIWHLRRVRDPAQYDRAIACWSIVAIVNAFTMNAIRPPTHTLNLGIQSLALLAMFLVIPSRLATRTAMAVLVPTLVAVMQLSGQRQVDLATMTLIWTTISLTIAMGMTLSARFQTLRREQFLSRLEIERTRDELYAIASTDALTGLLSRRRLFELAEEELGRARRYRRPLSLIAIDLDHFKRVNDRYGHAAGDAVLVAVANALRDQTRRQDLVGRIGGEELAVVLPETGLEAARQLAQRIRLKISALTPVADGAAIPVTVSLGVAEARPDDPSFQASMKRADRALYRAKDRGRDRVEAA